MIGKTNNTNNTTEVSQAYAVKVTRVKALDQNTYAFDMIVNGINIYSAWYKQGNKNGKDWSLISFPSHKGKNGNYYNHCSFPISDDLKAEIENQLSSLLGG